MATQRQDYLLRMIALAAAAIRRLRELLAGGGDGGVSAELIVEEARAAQGELLGRDASLLRALDPATAAGLLGDGRRIALWGELVRIEALALRRAGRDAEAAALDARADTRARLGDADALRRSLDDAT